MRNSTSIHELIHALTKAEKRFFKMYASLHTKGKNNNYILLFNAIDEQEEYDEERLIYKFRKYPFAKSIAKTKYLLRELILKTVRQLNINKTVGGRINELLDSTEIYYQKTLYYNCNSLLQRAKKLALENELTKAQKDIAYWELRLATYTKTTSKRLKGLNNNYTQLSDRLSFENELAFLLSNVQERAQKEPIGIEVDEMEKELKNFIDSWRPKIKIEAAGFRSRFLYLEIKAIFSQLRYELMLTKEAYEDLQKLWQSNPHLIEVYKEDYIRHSFNLCYIYINLEGDSLANKELVNNIRSIKFLTQQREDKKDLKLVLLEFMDSLAIENMEYAMIQFFEVNRLADLHKSKLEVSWRIQLHYLLAVFHFLKGEDNEALYWIETVDEAILEDQFPTIQNYCKLIQLIITYERGAYEMLEQEVRHVSYYLSKQKQKLPVEKSILNAVRQLLKVAPSSSDKTIRIMDSLAESLKLGEKQNDLSQILGTNAIYHWMKIRLSKDDKVIN